MISLTAQDGFMAETAEAACPSHLGSYQEREIEKRRNPVQDEQRNNAFEKEVNLGTIKITQDDEESTISLDSTLADFSSTVSAEVGVTNADSSLWTTNASLGSSQLPVQKSDNESGCGEGKERSLHPGIAHSRFLAQARFLESKQASLDTLANFPSSQEKFLDQMNQPNAFPCQSLRNGNFLTMAELENGSEGRKTTA